MSHKGRKKTESLKQTNSETLTDFKLKPYDKIHSSQNVWRSSTPLYCPEPFLMVMYSEKSEREITEAEICICSPNTTGMLMNSKHI